MSTFFDMDGNPISLLEWGRRLEDMSSRILLRDTVGDKQLITMWHGFVDPRIAGARLFGTVLLHEGPVYQELETYDSKTEAAVGHARHLRRLKMDLAHPPVQRES